jgi:multidrug efflux pump subunit AcrA (membrane-fusion protein)
VETRVSLPDAALELVDLPFGGVPSGRGPRAQLTAVLGPALASSTWTWEGRLVRMEGEVDPATRFFPGVIEVPNPYAGGPDGRPPLVAGMFVRAEIEGREYPEVAVVPRSALREDGRVLVVDGEDRIRIREVDAFWSSRDGDLLVRSGLRDGERVVTNPPAIVTEGMEVRVSLVDMPADPGGGGAPAAER